MSMAPLSPEVSAMVQATFAFFMIAILQQEEYGFI